MHPVAQLIVLVGAFVWLGVLFLNLPDRIDLSEITATRPTNDTQIAFLPIPTVSPTSTDLPTVTAVPSSTPWPSSSTAIPTSTPWPTYTPVFLPTATTLALQPSVQQAATLVPIISTSDLAPSFTEICDTNDTLTDIQQEALAASMAQKRVVGWAGTVYDVERDGNLYRVLVDMRQGFFLSRQVEIKNVSYDIASRLNVEQQIRFDGTIESVGMFLSDICNPIYIINASISF